MYCTGKQWAKWTWRVNEPNIIAEKMTRGIRDFTSFWAHKNEVNLDNAVFKIMAKKIEIPTEWEEDFLRKQMDKEWIEAGKAYWIEKEYRADIANIEDL